MLGPSVEDWCHRTTMSPSRLIAVSCEVVPECSVRYDVEPMVEFASSPLVTPSSSVMYVIPFRSSTLQ